MPRAALMLCLVAAPLAAQGRDLVVLLRDPSGKPVVGAQGRVRVEPAARMPALGDHDSAWSPPGAAARERQASSGPGGLLRFRLEDHEQPGAVANGIVWTDDGLGALLLGLHAGVAGRIELQPMAALATATGTETIAVFARAHLPGGRTVTLPARDGTSVRLPAGDYELWVQAEDGWLWTRRTLWSGKGSLLAFDGQARRLLPAAGTERVHPAGRPDVLLTRAEPCVLRGDALRAALVAVHPPRVVGPLVPAAAAGTGELHWPVADRTPAIRLHPASSPAADKAMVLYALERTAAGAWRVFGASRRHATGAAPVPFELPPPPDGDVWLLLVADGFAPQAGPWRGEGGPLPFALARGADLQVACRDEAGLPVADVAVDYVPDGMEPATVAAATDGHGMARFGRVLGPGRCRVGDPRFANQEIALATIPTGPLAVRLAPGATLHGVARWPDGAPARGVVVALRDPTGGLRPAERAEVSGDDGAFAFPGLPPDRPLVLFATIARDGRTWSCKAEIRLPGDGPVELVLRNEDPELRPR
ncbi:MAG: carboxypeptidase regulatory-like domain-containing protein [Planctomycetes bacterium]|nr:carboxypeptidase regulatory-like domain-containing protein [Planctomycetota bacterium]